MKTERFLLLAAGALACNAEPDALFVDWPELSARAWVTAVEQPPQLAASEGRQPRLFAGVLLPSELALLAYDRPLAELELAPGAIARGEACRPCGLAQPTAVFTALLPEDGPPAAPSPSSLPPWLREALVPDAAGRCLGCAPLEARELGFDTPGIVTVAAKLSDSEALVAQETGHIYRFTRAEPPRVDLVCSGGTAWWWSGALRGDVVWLSSAGGQLTQIRLDAQDGGPCRTSTVTRGPEGLGLRWLAVAPEPDPLEAVGVADDGRWFWLREGAWALGGALEVPRGGTPDLGRAVALGRRRFALTAGGTDTVLIDGDQVRVKIPGSDYQVTALAHDPELGLLYAADRDGGVLGTLLEIHAEATPIQLEAPPGGGMTALAVVEGVVHYVLNHGAVGRLAANACEPIPAGRSAPSRRVLALGDALLLADPQGPPAERGLVTLVSASRDQSCDP